MSSGYIKNRLTVIPFVHSNRQLKYRIHRKYWFLFPVSYDYHMNQQNIVLFRWLAFEEAKQNSISSKDLATKNTNVQSVIKLNCEMQRALLRLNFLYDFINFIHGSTYDPESNQKDGNYYRWFHRRFNFLSNLVLFIREWTSHIHFPYFSSLLVSSSLNDPI